MVSNSRGVAKAYEIPANAQYYELPRSDGDSSRWPTDTVEIVDSDNQVNYHKYLPLDDPVNKKWRHTIGMTLAKLLRYSSGDWALSEWPAGYRLFDHHKGPRDKPRHDIYLFGSSKKFRSCPEFLLHAKWLMTDPTLNPKLCECKYCNPKKPTQREISATLSAQNIIAKSGSPNSSPKPGRTVRRTGNTSSKLADQQHAARPHRIYASIQRVQKPYVKPIPSTKVHPSSRERNSDIRAMLRRSNNKIKRWFREGELLWCALKHPIPGPEGDGDDIVFWPALVDEIKNISTAVPRSPSNKDQPASPSSSLPLPIIPNKSGHPSESLILDDDKPPDWEVIQSNSYKMHLLGVNHTYTVPDTMVIPYRAYIPSEQLSRSIREYPFHSADLRKETVSNFNPCPETHIPAFEDAAVPYSKAVVEASKLGGFWSLTDEWEFKFTVPPPPDLSNPASISSAKTGPSGLPAEHQQAAKQMFGQPGAIATQKRYQGLWWGAERIWIDDLVRLRVGRSSLAPAGTEYILPPAGPSASVLKDLEAIGNDSGDEPKNESEKMDASTRGVFMRLEGLVVVEVPQLEGPPKKECRASGMLYELADIDYEEPSGSSWMNPDPDPNGAASSSTAIPNPQPQQQQGSSSSTANQLAYPIPGVTTYTLPEPPENFKFRQILRTGHEVVISLSMVSGRYYPGLLQHPLLGPMLDEFIDSVGSEKACHLFALEGLTPGFFNCIEPERYKEDREGMLRDADREADRELDDRRRLAQEVEMGFGEDNDADADIEDDDVDMDGEEDDQSPRTPPRQTQQNLTQSFQ